jgi:hypothetical protein
MGNRPQPWKRTISSIEKTADFLCLLTLRCFKYREMLNRIAMKKLLITIAAFVLVIGSAPAAVLFTPVGHATVKMGAVALALPFQQIGVKTNQSKTTTNITQMFKATTKETPFENTNLLAVLANSFNTNFPAGSQIGVQLGQLLVVDSTGTNVIFTPNGVVSFQFDEEFVPATETLVTTESASGTQSSGNLSETILASATMNYDDTLNTTGDGTHTKFAFKGLYMVTVTENIKTRVFKAIYQFDGTGGGPIRDVPTILTGTITGKGTGAQPAF